jgi:hypothetical protein
MRKLRWEYWIITLLILIANNVVWARGGHGHRHHHHLNLGIGIGSGYYSGFYGPGFYGSGFYGPGFYGYRSYGYPDPFFNRPFYGYPPIVVVPPVTPPVYIQREQLKPTQPQVGYWHYCQNPAGYYPSVKSCPGGWLQVPPQSSTP